MRRILSAATAALCVLLCIADIWLWVRGYEIGDTLVYRWVSNTTTARFIQLWTGRGGLRILVGFETYPPESPPQLFSWEPGLHHGSYGGPSYPTETWGDGKIWGGLGFYYYQLSAPFSPVTHVPRLYRTYRAVTFPHAFLALLLALWPLRFAWSMRRRRIQRRRLKNGLCLRCGYDIRGLSENCPECGAKLATFSN